MKELLINYNGAESPVKMRRLNWGELQDSLRKALVGKNVDLVLREELQILSSLIECPFPKNLESLRGLDWEEGEKLKKAFEELNIPSGDKKKTFAVNTGAKTQS